MMILINVNYAGIAIIILQVAWGDDGCCDVPSIQRALIPAVFSQDML